MRCSSKTEIQVGRNSRNVTEVCELQDARGPSFIKSLEKPTAFCWGANGFVETHQALGHQIALTKQQRFEEAETDGLNFL